MVSSVFLGAETNILTGREGPDLPVRRALRRSENSFGISKKVPSEPRRRRVRARLPDQEDCVDRNGVKVHYEVYGTGEHTLLFMPAFPIGHSRKWKGQLPYFSRHYRCIALDPRGNGKSDRPVEVEAYRLEEYVADAEFCEALKANFVRHVR